MAVSQTLIKMSSKLAQDICGKEIQVRVPTDYEMTKIVMMEELLQTSTRVTRPTVLDKKREGEQIEKYKVAFAYLDNWHVVVIFLYLVYPKESIKKQGHAVSSILQVSDLKTRRRAHDPYVPD